MIKRIPTQLRGLVLFAPEIHRDDRGFFVETYRQDELAALGVVGPFVQDNHARSNRGTLRGLHFQLGAGQSKLVRVARGHVLDVVVDIRSSSSTFGRYEAFDLDDVAHMQLYIPVGFAHGYLVVSETADVAYKVTSYYDPGAERGIAWNDPRIRIRWPLPDPLVSARDRALPPLDQVKDELPPW